MIDWESIDTRDLKERLKTELATESPDRQTVNGILEELEKRDPVREIPIEVVVEWDRIKAKKKAKSHRLKPLWKAAIAAVLAVSLLGIVPPALGSENIFETVSRWTKDLFSFGEPKQTEYIFKTDHPGLQELYDAVTELGVTQNVVPTWLPDGFQIDLLEKKTTPKGITVIANFINGEKDIQMYVVICGENREIAYQKDESFVEVREYGGIKFYIMENEGKFYAAWAVDNVECSIYADTKEDLYKIVKSIH